MSLKDAIASDVLRLVFNTDEFADLITYTGDDDTPRLIKALIEEPTEEDLNEVSAALNYRVKRIHVYARDNVNGVVKPNRLGVMNEEGGDQISMPLLKDQFSAVWYVRKILSSDSYCHVLQIVDNQGAAIP